MDLTSVGGNGSKDSAGGDIHMRVLGMKTKYCALNSSTVWLKWRRRRVREDMAHDTGWTELIEKLSIFVEGNWIWMFD